MNFEYIPFSRQQRNKPHRLNGKLSIFLWATLSWIMSYIKLFCFQMKQKGKKEIKLKFTWGEILFLRSTTFVTVNIDQNIDKGIILQDEYFIILKIVQCMCKT